MLLSFSTKSETLHELKKIIKNAIILHQYAFTADQWKQNMDPILAEFYKLSWSKNSIIIRSSSINEDRPENSLAGKFDSFLNVYTKEETIKAVENVISSFGNGSGNDIIFFQPIFH